MEMVLSNRFCEISQNEMSLVEGGGWVETGAIVLGTVFIGFAPITGILVGVGSSVVGTPVIGVTAGIGAGANMVAAGTGLIDWATSQ